MQKQILLIGDSIRMGYDMYVKESMRDLAQVGFPKENCRNTSYVLRELHNWKSELHMDDCDAVHFNVGHWDTIRIYGDEPLTRLDVYAENLTRIVKRMRFLFPNALLIFATSTPILENRYLKEFEYRSNCDVETYNEIAVRTLMPLGVQINDLYELLKNRPELHSDQSHYYTPDAVKLIGGQVSACLCNALGLDQTQLLQPDPQCNSNTKLKNDNEMYIKRGNYYELVQGQ